MAALRPPDRGVDVLFERNSKCCLKYDPHTPAGSSPPSGLLISAIFRRMTKMATKAAKYKAIGCYSAGLARKRWPIAQEERTVTRMHNNSAVAELFAKASRA